MRINVMNRIKRWKWLSRYFGQNQVDMGKMKAKLRLSGTGNSILAKVTSKGSVVLKVKGCNNSIVIEEGVHIRGKLTITIAGDNNKIVIGKNVIVVSNLTITIVKGCQGGRVEIGEGTTFWDTIIQNYDNNSSVTIGKDCMFSYNTALVNSDEHIILKDGNVCNHARDLVIGDHVWVGYEASVMKNSNVADGSILGRSAVVSGKFDIPKSVIVGNPGRVVKTGVDWLRTESNQMPT